MYYPDVGTVRAFSLLKTATVIAVSSAIAAVTITGFGAAVDLGKDSTSDSLLRNAVPDFSSPATATEFSVPLIEALEIFDDYTVIVHSAGQALLPAPAFINGNGKLLIDSASTAHGSKVSFSEKHGLVAGVTTEVTSLTGNYYTEVIRNQGR